MVTVIALSLAAFASDGTIQFEGRNDLEWRVLRVTDRKTGALEPVCERTPCAIAVPPGSTQRYVFARRDALLAKQTVNLRPDERVQLEARRGNKAAWIAGATLIALSGASFTVLGAMEGATGTTAGVIPYGASAGAGLIGLPLVIGGAAKVKARRLE